MIVRRLQLTEIIPAFANRCVLVLAAAFVSSAAPAEQKRPVDGIMDNSFLVEEAYNQEEGIVQNIFTAAYGVDKVSGPRSRTFDLAFTQEWPVFSQDHQFSYTVPYGFAWEKNNYRNGVGDVLLNYRYQAWFDEKTLTAFAPRFSLVLPTGDDRAGFGNDTLGYQWNLPFSTALNDRWFVHANAGLTFLPEIASSSHDTINYNLGASAIYCVNDRFHLMAEWIGAWNEHPTRSGWKNEFSSVISPGVRYAFNLKGGAQIVVGLGVPIGLTSSAAEIGALGYFSFESRLFGKEKQ